MSSKRRFTNPIISLRLKCSKCNKTAVCLIRTEAFCRKHSPKYEKEMENIKIQLNHRRDKNG